MIGKKCINKIISVKFSNFVEQKEGMEIYRKEFFERDYVNHFIKVYFDSYENTQLSYND